MNEKVVLKYESRSNEKILRLFFKEKNKYPYKVIIKNNSNILLYEQEVGILQDEHINSNFNFYFTVSNNNVEICVKIFEKDQIVHDELIRIRSSMNICIDDPTVLIYAWHLGLGDCLWANASIKKLYKAFNRKINVITRYPELLINNPYVNNVYKIDNKTESHKDVIEKYGRLINKNFFEIFPYNTDKWGIIDLRETAAFNCGFHLTPEERQIEFFPNKFESIDLPNKYVLVNPRIAGCDRDLGKEKWQKLVDILNENDVNVVTIGVKNKQEIPEYHDLKVKLGVNLCGLECQSNLSQTWHLMNQANCFVTFDTGMYILSGTTNTQLFLIGWYAEPYWHKPFRNGSYDYKLKVIEGECKEKCQGNLKYYVRQHAKLTQPRVQQCALNYSEFKCIPSVEKIASDVIEYYKNR